MATYYITHVRLSSAGGGAIPHHQHIDAVKLSDGQQVTRQAIAKAIKDGDVVYTLPPSGAPKAQVYVMRYCPAYACLSTDYITTHRDSTTQNNLLRLPKF